VLNESISISDVFLLCCVLLANSNTRVDIICISRNDVAICKKWIC